MQALVNGTLAIDDEGVATKVSEYADVIKMESSIPTALKKAIEAAIKEKESDLVGNMASQGTTPRRLTDLIGSLCDLTSGSGDKGTPVVFIQGYFDNLASD